MKIPVTTTKLAVMTKPEPTQSKDGKSTFFKIGIVVGSECGMLNCNEDVFRAVEVGKTYEAQGHYDTEYKNLRLVNVVFLK